MEQVMYDGFLWFVVNGPNKMGYYNLKRKDALGFIRNILVHGKDLNL